MAQNHPAPPALANGRKCSVYGRINRLRTDHYRQLASHVILAHPLAEKLSANASMSNKNARIAAISTTGG
jgi:hypothetical protein